MRLTPVLTLIASTALVGGLALALRTGTMPLGVKGEWEWLRLPVSPTAIDLTLAAAGVMAFAVVAGVGMSVLRKRVTPGREAWAVVALLPASVVVQAVVQTGAPAGYGLEKWVVALSQEGSSGYFTAAKQEVTDPWAFLAAYSDWIRRQDALHIGTHPPGLILSEACLLRAMERSPGSARFVTDHAPDSVTMAFRLFEPANRFSTPERATLILTGFLTLLASSATVVPLYLLGRASLPAPESLAAAALWPLVPSAVLFQPAADTAFPLLSTTALAFAAHAGCRQAKAERWGLSILAGLVLSAGMQLTLAFLPVGLVVAVVLLGSTQMTWRQRFLTLVATGVGFLGLTLMIWAVTRANPFVIWWWNQRNHARFYVEYRRSYLAWVVANPVELSVAIGLPATAWACLGVSRPGGLPGVSVATAAVLFLLTVGGRNLSEVARLWLPFMPALLVAAGYAIGRFGGGPKCLTATVALVGAQTLILEAAIQVVYPV